MQLVTFTFKYNLSMVAVFLDIQEAFDAKLHAGLYKLLRVNKKIDFGCSSTQQYIILSLKVSVS